jgi:NADH-quinone oxidoreductase subunit N
MIPSIKQEVLLSSMFDFLPELILSTAIVVLLLIRLFSRSHLGPWAMFFAILALGASIFQWLGNAGLGAILQPVGLDINSGLGKFLNALKLVGPNDARVSLLFGDETSGLLIYDFFTVYFRIFLLSFVVLMIWLSFVTGIPDAEDSGDFYVLLFGATLGMMLMTSAAHLLMVFIAIEMTSTPSYVLAGFLKGRKQSSEAALKYVVYGGGAAGIMLYGISLLAGTFGTGYLPDVAAGVVATLKPAEGSAPNPVVILGLLFLFVGIAFKLSLVPFHFWCPDVFEGASAEIAGFLSVASKAAALALLARFTLFFGGLDPIFRIDDPKAFDFMATLSSLMPVLAFIAALTVTVGNLAAFRQTNLKRLLAYSTIAHAGYMLMGLCTMTKAGVDAVLFYLIAYLFMNLGAFAVVAFVRNQTLSEELPDLRGLVRRSPFLVVTLSIFLLSLLGMPPLVGFAAKFQIFAVLYTDGQTYTTEGQPGLGALLFGLLMVAGLNTVLSAFYYLNVMKVMILDVRPEDIEGTPPKPLPTNLGPLTFAGTFAIAVFLLGILWGPLDAFTRKTTARLRDKPGADIARAVPPPGGLAPVVPGGGPPGGGGSGGGGPPGKKK